MSNLVSLPQFCPTRLNESGKKYLIATLVDFNARSAKEPYITEFDSDDGRRALDAHTEEATRKATVEFNRTKQKIELHSAYIELGKMFTGHIATVSFNFEHFDYDVCEAGDL